MAQHREEQKLIGVSEAAKRLNVSPATLRRWVNDGVIQAVKLPSGHRRFIPDEVERMRRELGMPS